MKIFKCTPEEQLAGEIEKHSSKEKQKTTGNTDNVKWRRRRICTIYETFRDEVKTILCIGARSNREVTDFIDFKDGYYQAEGIDICSSSLYIRQIDAHYMDKYYDRNAFDFIYACHCLEHMYDVNTVMKHIRKIAKVGCVITLPVGKKAITPSIGHPSIFDIMVDNPNPNELSDKYLKDFEPLQPYKLLEYHKSKDYEEIDLYFRWI